mmetsp:Transcript_13123/g.31073  ORF Transcript_13123/g.31073 Transcript_13123/m.31073 type:complete len:243 (+) Transcript_13123:156-884(+)
MVSGVAASTRHRINSNKPNDSEYGSKPRSPTDQDTERSFRILEGTRRQRRFEATARFDEYCQETDRSRMKVDQLKPYMARVFNTTESAFEEEAIKLVVKAAKKKSKKDEHFDGTLSKRGVVSGVLKYGEYVRHWKTIQGLFHESDWSNDGKLQRRELRKLIEEYEASQKRNTELTKNVLLFVTEQDLNFILEAADDNHDGDIDATEVVCAIAAWEELAAIKMNDFEKMNCKCSCHSKGCIIS